jgi:hypothetical protein
VKGLVRRLLVSALLASGIAHAAKAGETPFTEVGRSQSPDPQPEAVIGSGPPVTTEERTAAKLAPLELEPLVVGSRQITFEQELTFRLVRSALDRPRSQARDRFDEWICWFDRPTGTAHYHLSCARNGDLYALQPKVAWELSATRGQGSYGTILTTTRPVNRAALLQALRDLPGTNEFDEEFVTRALQGERPPRDIPDEDELDRFTIAWTSVARLTREGADDLMLESAITSAGLDVDRYNRIASLTEQYQSIENEVARRLQD